MYKELIIKIKGRYFDGGSGRVGKKLKGYTNNLCKDGAGNGEGNKQKNNEKGMYGILLPKQYSCSVPIGTNFYTLKSNDGSCIDIGRNNLLKIGESKEIKKIKTEKLRQQKKIEGIKGNSILSRLKRKKIESKIRDLEEKEGYESLSVIRGKMKSVKLGGQMEVDGNKMICSNVGFFGKGGKIKKEIINPKLGENSNGENFLQFVKKDSCGGKFKLKRYLEGGIIKKMEIKASCENKDHLGFETDLGYECNEWGGNGIDDFYVRIEYTPKNYIIPKKVIIISEDEDGNEFEIISNQSAINNAKNKKDKYEEDLQKWKEERQICEDSEKNVKNKKACWFNASFGYLGKEEKFNYGVICKIKYAEYAGFSKKIHKIIWKKSNDIQL